MNVEIKYIALVLAGGIATWLYGLIMNPRNNWRREVVQKKSMREYMDNHGKKLMSFRSIGRSDIPFLKEMIRKNFSEIYPLDQMDIFDYELHSAFAEDWWGKPKYFLIETKEGTIAFGGFYHSAMDDGMYELTWINTDNKLRKLGVGRFLVEQLIKEIKKTSSCKEDLTILLSCKNHLINFYKKSGFKVALKKAAKEEVIMVLTFKHPVERIARDYY